MGRVNVADVKAGALAGQTTRSKGREPTLVRDFGERVGLIHELRELRGSEEFFDHRRDRLGVDQLRRGQRFDLRETHALLDRLLHANQTDAVLVLQQLTDRADAPVAKVVDIIDLTLLVLQVDQVLNHLQDVIAGQRGLGIRVRQAELVVDLMTTDR